MLLTKNCTFAPQINETPTIRIEFRRGIFRRTWRVIVGIFTYVFYGYIEL